MKTFNEKVITVKEVDKVLCNCCGNPAVIHDTDGHTEHWECTIKINDHWDAEGGGRTTDIEYHICKFCWTPHFSVIPWKLPPNVDERKYSC